MQNLSGWLCPDVVRVGGRGMVLTPEIRVVTEGGREEGMLLTVIGKPLGEMGLAVDKVL